MKFIGDRLTRFRGRILMEDPLTELWTEMKKLCDAGLSSQEVLAFLQNTRAFCYDEPVVGTILELMDIASGRCASNLRIWQEETKV